MRTKWYNKWWIKVAAGLMIIIILYIATKKTITYVNYQEYLKTEIETLKKENTKLDSLYKTKVLEKEKIKIIREKISIQSELDRLTELTKQLEEVRKTELNKIDTISPEQLQIYLQKELK